MRNETVGAKPGILNTPWIQLATGVVCMAMIANLQYGWTLFVNPIDAKFHWGKPAIQIAFSIFVFTETWLVPVEAWFVDRYGPRVMIIFGGVLVATAWVINAFAASLFGLYLGAVVAGVGAGAVYGTCVGNALKWFPQRRGLAAGCTAAGFGAGAALTVVPIANMIAAEGYETAFITFGIGQGVVILALSFLLRQAPVPVVKPKPSRTQTARDYRPAAVIRMPVFWLMYLMFVLVASGGLMTAAQIGPIADDFKIANVPVSLLGLTLPALTFAISLDRILDGFGRPFFGWVSDRIGRENTMVIAFGTGAAALLVLAQYGSNPVVFVFASAIFFGVFGEIYSLFPATSGDTFGSSFAATNAGMLYTAKGTAALLVPLASLLASGYGWHAVFVTALAFNASAALLAFFALKPLRARFLAESRTAPAHLHSAAAELGGEGITHAAARWATPRSPGA
jgi:OFA family oxalate/formate antiporter-like MFS transporter